MKHLDEVTFCFIGDIFPANLNLTVGYGVANEFKQHSGDRWFNSIRELTNNCDFVCGNIEAPLIDNDNSHNMAFAGNATFAQFLKSVGVNILSVANNHILEYGFEGFTQTLTNLRKNNIVSIGHLDKGVSQLRVIEKNSSRIGIVAYNDVHDIELKDTYSYLSDSNIDFDLERFELVDVDYKIASVHWGWREEYINYPSYQTIQSARKMVDKGFDIIVGHHPHVVQPIEIYKDKLIIYSLGNFLFDMLWSENVRSGLAVKVFLSKITRKIRFEEIPIYIKNDYTPSITEESKYRNKMGKYIDKMNSFSSDLLKYTSMRNNEMRKAQLYQRFLMKLFLVKNWNKLSDYGKKQYIDIFNKKFKSVLNYVTN